MPTPFSHSIPFGRKSRCVGKSVQAAGTAAVGRPCRVVESGGDRAAVGIMSCTQAAARPATASDFDNRVFVAVGIRQHIRNERTLHFDIRRFGKPSVQDTIGGAGRRRARPIHRFAADTFVDKVKDGNIAAARFGHPASVGQRSVRSSANRLRTPFILAA